MMKKVIVILMLLAVAGVSSGLEGEPRYAPSSYELTERALSFDEITFKALVDWQVVKFEVLTEDDLKNLDFLGKVGDEGKGLVYGEIVEYEKNARGLTVVVLEFKNEIVSKKVFASALKWAKARGVVDSPEFGDEGYATGEKSTLPYINCYRMGRFMVFVKESGASLYEVKMMARKIMKELIPLYEKEILRIGPFKITSYQFYPYILADSGGIRIWGLDLYVNKNVLIGIIVGVVLLVFLTFIVLSIFIIRRVGKKRAIVPGGVAVFSRNKKVKVYEHLKDPLYLEEGIYYKLKRIFSRK
jgi:hypothetical protein